MCLPVRIAKPSKPEKPSKDFPLFAHNSGKWAKKVNGRCLYFGRWEDPDGALQEYRKHVDEFERRRNGAAYKLQYDRRKATEARSTTYGVTDFRYIKIGHTSLLEQRVEKLQLGNPEVLHVLFLIPGNCEKELHARFAHLHVRGEWFTITHELLDWINANAFIKPEAFAKARQAIS